jgi:hypothetical protein
VHCLRIMTRWRARSFVGNGIPKRPNDLDYVKYYSNDQIKAK